MKLLKTDDTLTNWHFPFEQTTPSSLTSYGPTSDSNLPAIPSLIYLQGALPLHASLVSKVPACQPTQRLLSFFFTNLSLFVHLPVHACTSSFVTATCCHPHRFARLQPTTTDQTKRSRKLYTQPLRLSTRALAYPKKKTRRKCRGLVNCCQRPGEPILIIGRTQCAGSWSESLERPECPAEIGEREDLCPVSEKTVSPPSSSPLLRAGVLE